MVPQFQCVEAHDDTGIARGRICGHLRPHSVFTDDRPTGRSLSFMSSALSFNQLILGPDWIVWWET